MQNRPNKLPSRKVMMRDVRRHKSKKQNAEAFWKFNVQQFFEQKRIELEETAFEKILESAAPYFRYAAQTDSEHYFASRYQQEMERILEDEVAKLNRNITNMFRNEMSVSGMGFLINLNRQGRATKDQPRRGRGRPRKTSTPQKPPRRNKSRVNESAIRNRWKTQLNLSSASPQVQADNPSDPIGSLIRSHETEDIRENNNDSYNAIII